MSRSLEEETAILTQEYEDLRNQQKAETLNHNLKVKNLEQMINDKKSQQQNLLDKLDSLRLKLEHSNRKANQKKFLAKQEELLTDLRQMEDKGESLSAELEGKKEALLMLEDEQILQKQTWDQEMADLHEERDRLKKEVDEGSQTVMREEIEALEFQREVYMSEIQEWLAEAEKHIQSLRSNPTPEYLHQSLEWERRVATIRSTMSSLQDQFNDMFKKIQQGQILEELPAVILPPLPEVPVLLFFSQPSYLVPGHPYGFMGRPAAPQIPPFRQPPVHMSHGGPSFQSLVMPALGPGPPAAVVQAPHPGSVPPHRGLAPGHVGAAPQRPFLQTITPPLAPAASAAAAQPPQPSQLDKVLQMLGTRLPTRTKAELTTALQQIKSARGTLAGMAMEDLCQQVAERLEHSQKPAMRPVGHPPVGTPPQQPSHLQQAIPSPSQRQWPRVNVCLVCQEHVDEQSQYKMRCSHIIHTQCVRVWLQSGTKKECPICPD